MIGIGTIAGVLFLENQIKINKIDFTTDRKIYVSIIISAFFGLLGAKIFMLLYKQSTISIHNLIKSGVTFYGGLLSGGFLFILLCRIFHIQTFKSINLVIPSLILAHAFGRIGCFFAGCCYGKPTNSILGVSFPIGSIPFAHFGELKLHAVQLYEASFLFLLFFLIIKLFNYYNRLPIYLIAYGIFRFFIEFLRGDDRGNLFSIKVLSPSQIISLMLILLGILLIISLNMKRILRPQK
jgi:phosphatidylglycerol:prolipoprotein diacylglycerol transferase